MKLETESEANMMLNEEMNNMRKSLALGFLR